MNPYESPKECCEAGPFRRGLLAGANVLVFLLGAIAGFVTTVVRMIFSKEVVTEVIAYALLGLMVWPLWNFVATAAFDYFNYISYLQAIGLVLLCRILFKTAPATNKGETLSAQEKLLIDLVRTPGSLPVGSAAGLNTPRRAGSGPERPVPQSSRT